MKFFIPSIPSEEALDFLNNSIVKYLETYGHKINLTKKIYSITFEHKGNTITETVGKISPSNNEHIFAILEANNMYLTCTKHRGILGGEPLLTGKHVVKDIVYFENTEKDTYKYGDWTYKLKNNNHEVLFPTELPDSVYKYYNNNNYSKDAILNQYLFCSHPYHLNDSMDCTELLWDFSKTTKHLHKEFYKNFKDSPFLKQVSNYKTDKKDNFKRLKNTFWKIHTDRTGIISLSGNPLDTLMWSHYASEKGYMIEFDRTKLINRMKTNNPTLSNYVFMPIQYVDVLEQIDFFSEDFLSADIPFLYSINIKKKVWEYEKEWRLVCYSDNYGVPNSILFPEPNYEGTKERKLYYDLNTVKSFTLGKYFFNGSNLSKINPPDTFRVKNESDINFVNFLYDNFNEMLFQSDEVQTGNKFQRNRFKVKLTKIDNNTFKLTKI